MCQSTPRQGGGYFVPPMLGGTPQPRSGLGETPIPGQDNWGSAPSQVRMGYPPPIRTGWGPPSWDWVGYPPIKTGWGTPQLRLDGGTPLPSGDRGTEQLRGGWYASCVHAGGLSCSFTFVKKKVPIYFIGCVIHDSHHLQPVINNIESNQCTVLEGRTGSSNSNISFQVQRECIKTSKVKKMTF